ncbi:MAG: ABC transporter permease [Acidobacteriota bacterium]
MKLRRTLGPGLRALLVHRVRAGLAFASIGVGVAAIVFTSALGAGAEGEVQRKIDALGTNLLVVRPAQVQTLTGRKSMRGSVTTLSVDDYEAIAALPLAALTAPAAEGVLRVKAGHTAMATSVLGTNPSFPRVRRFALAAGRFLDERDDREARRVAVLGARVSESLFPGESPIGREIRLRSIPFEVIGVLEAKGAMADGSDLDNQVLVPIRTALRRVFNTRWLSNVYVDVRNEPGAGQSAAMDSAVQTIAALVRTRHRERHPARAAQRDDFSVQNTSRFLAMQKQATGTLGVVASGIAGLALLVGGTGILALLLLAVRERTAEIGLRMAVGARRRDIVVQFLLEASLLSLGGWVAGLAVGGLGATWVAFATDWKVGVPGGAVLVSLAMVVLIGLGFGAIPARQASLLAPADALHTE